MYRKRKWILFVAAEAVESGNENPTAENICLFLRRSFVRNFDGNFVEMKDPRVRDLTAGGCKAFKIGH